jgi:hypothetical protein
VIVVSGKPAAFGLPGWVARGNRTPGLPQIRT